ncbi:MAG: GNAT family N-acetyltransferase [Candidatus Bathyarchaeia archaeon]
MKSSEANLVSAPDAVSQAKWQQEYEKKVRELDEALTRISVGNKIFVGSACGEPQYLVNGLVEKGKHLQDNQIFHIHTLGVAPYANPIYSSRFHLNAFFVGANTREAVSKGLADYTPIFLSDIPNMIRSRQFKIDVALIQVTPPDEHGFCSLGVSVDITKAAAEAASLVIAQVNPKMPRVLGDSFIHVNDIHVIVEHEEPILEAPRSEHTAVSEKIGKYVSRLVEDESTLQVGIGSIPDSVLDYLGDKRDLGIHTELLTEGVVDLVEDGVVTNMKKTINRGKIIASFAMGTKKLYDFIDDNPMVEFHQEDYVNDPFIISQHDKMVSINQGLEIDLTGQVCSDSLGPYFYSGLGGQADFMRGAAKSRGGKAITVLPSTAKEETVSRIKPFLTEGAGVVLTRGDVCYVITEYGMAFLKGKTVRERALSLIGLAHPKFRSELTAWAVEHNYFRPGDYAYPNMLYPEELEKHLMLKDGQEILLRPAKPSDLTMKHDLFYTFSKQTIAFRYFGGLKAMPLDKVKRYVNIDYTNEMTIVGVIRRDAAEEIVAIGQYLLDPLTGYGEVALAVQDEWQGKGIGKALLGHLCEIAKDRGLKGFTAWVLKDNERMMRLFKESGYAIEVKPEQDLYFVRLHFEPR